MGKEKLFPGPPVGEENLFLVPVLDLYARAL